MYDIKSLVKQSSINHPLRKSMESGDNYYKDFERCLVGITNVLSEKEIKDLLHNKLQLGMSEYNSTGYYQAATELSVIDKFRSIPYDDFQYEKPVRKGTKKNPECTLLKHPFIINIEAKSPVIPAVPTVKNEQNKGLIFKAAGRLPTYKSDYKTLKDDLENSGQDVELLLGKNKDNTMKDFLQSAHDKFADFRDDNELNVLVVSLGNAHMIQEWCHYLYNHEGLLTAEPFVEHDSFSRVDVIIYTNLLHRHMNSESIKGSAWMMDDSFNLFLSNPFRQGVKNDVHRFLIPYIPNYSKEIQHHQVSGVAPQDLLDSLRVGSFIAYELEENQGIMLF